MEWTNLLILLGGNAGLLAILGYLFNSFITHQLSKDLELHKAQIDLNNQKLLETYSAKQEIAKNLETKRLEAAAQHLQCQIEELYAPLYGLIQESIIVWSTEKGRKEAAEKKKKQTEHQTINEDDSEQVHSFFVENYYIHINMKIAELLRTKVHLFESEDIPDSYKNFIKHQATQQCLYNLYKEKKIDSSFYKGDGWPENFEEDVKKTLAVLKKRHNEYIKRLEPNHITDEALIKLKQS